MKYKSQVPAPYLPFCLITIITYKTPYQDKIDIFRKFRDKILLGKMGYMGKVIVKAYYKLSSKLLKIAKVKLFQKILIFFVIKPLIDVYYVAKKI